MISYICSCGKRYELPDDKAGARVKCPACGAAGNVPGVGAAPERQVRAGAQQDWMWIQRPSAAPERPAFTEHAGTSLPTHAIVAWMAAAAAVIMCVVLLARPRVKVVEREVEKRVEVPVEKIVERVVETPVEKIIEKPVVVERVVDREPLAFKLMADSRVVAMEDLVRVMRKSESGLEGMTAVQVIVLVNEAAEKAGVTSERLKTLAELRLRREGVGVTDEDEAGPNAGEFYVHLDVSERKDIGLWRYALHTSVVQRVVTCRSPERLVLARTWMESRAGSGEKQDSEKAVEESLSKALDSFANEWAKAQEKLAREVDGQIKELGNANQGIRTHAFHYLTKVARTVRGKLGARAMEAMRKVGSAGAGLGDEEERLYYRLGVEALGRELGAAK